MRDLANNTKSKTASKLYRGNYDEFFNESFNLNSISFSISSYLVAKPIEGKNQGTPLFKVGNFNVYEDKIEEPLRHHLYARVIYNKSIKRYGVLTGLIFIRFYKQVEDDWIEKVFPVDVQSKIEHLGLTIVLPREGVSLIELEDLLTQSEAVQDFEIEILSGDLHEK